MVTMDNYEEYMIMHADGELQPQEEQALMDFLAAHPQLQGEMDIYSSIRLEPDTNVVFAAKDKLLKPVAETKVIPMPWYRNYAVAAGVAAAIVIVAVAMMHNGNNNAVEDAGSQLAANKPAAHSNMPQNAATVTAAPATATTTPLQQEATPANGTPAQPVTQAGQGHYVAAHKDPKPHTADNAVVNNSNRHMQAALVEMRQGEYKVLDVATTGPEPLAIASATLPAIETAPETKETWFDKLPLDEQKKKNINNVATAIANGCEKISSLKDNASRIGFSMRLEKKNLIVSF